MNVVQDGSFRRKPTPCSNHFVFTADNQVKDCWVPDGARTALFSASDNFFANFFGAASVPSDDVSDGSSGLAQNPENIDVQGISNISLAANTGTIITVEFYT
jgi:hypothetical protein